MNSNELILKDKVALITGAGKGIGKSIAKVFAKKGAIVVVNVFNSLTSGIKTIEEITSEGGTGICIQTDIGNSSEVKKLIDQVIDKYGRIDILVNNSGIGSGDTMDMVTEISEKDWDKVFEVNIKGTMLTSKYCIPHMIKNRGGSIINISSIRGLLGNPVLASYCSSKGAVVLLTKQMALDYGKYNIRVNCLCPGFIKTEMFKTYLKKQTDPGKAEKIFAEMSPMNRIGEPEEIANVALFFGSDLSSFITGVALPVDGGYVSYGVRKVQ